MIQLDQFLTLEGISMASQGSCFWIKTMNVLLDIGICLRRIVKISNVLITHAHMDHAAGLAYYLSQRALFHFHSANIYVPSENVILFRNILESWQQLENVPYDFRLIGVEEGMRYELNKNYSFIAYPVHHRVPALGYTIWEEKQKLKPKYFQLSKGEILDLRKNNVEIVDKIQTPILSYLGDCDFSSFVNNPIFQQSRYLILECTFMGDRKTAKHAKNWGHIHLDEIISHPELFRNNHKIVLAHFSLRYSQEYVENMVASKCPPELKEKLSLWFS